MRKLCLVSRRINMLVSIYFILTITQLVPITATFILSFMSAIDVDGADVTVNIFSGFTILVNYSVSQSIPIKIPISAILFFASMSEFKIL